MLDPFVNVVCYYQPALLFEEFTDSPLCREEFGAGDGARQSMLLLYYAGGVGASDFVHTVGF